ncbi:MAG TPA: hypothetical protein VFT34_04635 [Verrucomicrobiae bacterium]|nr:hypothetical protein [Verrucomicrobiae bacterium]
MNRKRLIFVVLALLIVAVCVAIFVLTDGGPSESTQTLADGSVLTLRRITKGTKHRYVSGNLLQRTASRALPESWAKKLGAQVVTYNSSNVTHVIWMERLASSNSLRSYGFQTTFGPYITNDAGFDRSYRATAQLYAAGRDIQGFLLDACPTDSRIIPITIRQQSFARLPNVSFNMSNPDFVARRRWQARPCPISVDQDQVSLCVERFTTRTHDPTTPTAGPWTELSFMIRDRAVPTNNWFARSVRLFNEAGSEFLPPLLPTEASLARTNASFPFGLSSAEPYKLSFELRRTSYGPEDQHVFVAVPVPAANGPTSQPQRAKLQGFTLVLALTPGGGISARIEPPTSAWRLDPVRVVDDHGRWLQVRGSSSNDGRFSGAVALKADSATVDLTFGLTRLRTLEVIAQPSLGP